jgi:hypothetical protein
MNHGELLNVYPPDKVGTKQAAQGEAIGRKMKVRRLGVQLNGEDRQGQCEEPNAQIPHRLAVVNHHDANRDKNCAAEKQERGPRPAGT